MSIMGGLVGSEAGSLDVTRHNALGDWTMRHAWALGLLLSLSVWGLLAAILILA